MLSTTLSSPQPGSRLQESLLDIPAADLLLPWSVGMGFREPGSHLRWSEAFSRNGAHQRAVLPAGKVERKRHILPRNAALTPSHSLGVVAGSYSSPENHPDLSVEAVGSRALRDGRVAGAHWLEPLLVFQRRPHAFSVFLIPPSSLSAWFSLFSLLWSGDPW